MDGVPGEGFWWVALHRHQKEWLQDKIQVDIVGGFRRSLAHRWQRATDAMTHRCVRRCQRGRGWSFTLRDAVARGFMADGDPCPLAVTGGSIGGEVQRGCVAIVGGSRFEERTWYLPLFRVRGHKSWKITSKQANKQTNKQTNKQQTTTVEG